MKLQQLQDLSADQVFALWQKYHNDQRSTAPLCLTAEEWRTLRARLAQAPMMALPLPRSAEEGGDGPGAFVTLVTQSLPPQRLLVTTAEEFKQRGAAAPPHAVVTMYDELLESKGIALGRVDVVGGGVLTKDTALRFVENAAEMYLVDERFAHVQAFNKAPERFDFSAVCALFGCRC